MYRSFKIRTKDSSSPKWKREEREERGERREGREEKEEREKREEREERREWRAERTEDRGERGKRGERGEREERGERGERKEGRERREVRDAHGVDLREVVLRAPERARAVLGPLMRRQIARAEGVLQRVGLPIVGVVELGEGGVRGRAVPER